MTDVRKVLELALKFSWLDCFTYSIESTGPNSVRARLGPTVIRIVGNSVKMKCGEKVVTPVNDLENDYVRLRLECGLSTLCHSRLGKVKLNVVRGVEELPTFRIKDLENPLRLIYKKPVLPYLGSYEDRDMIYVLKTVRSESDLWVQLYNPRRRSFWHVSLNELKKEYPEIF